MNLSQNVRQRVKVTSPGDMVSILPYYVGFQPTDSVVVVGMSGPRREIGPVLRYDREAPPNELAADALVKLAHLGITAAYVALYCDEPDMGEHPEAFIAQTEYCGVELADVVIVRDGRWRSYLCDDLQCCPTEGIPVPDGSSGVGAQVAAAAALEGRAVLKSREELAAAVKAPVALAAQAGDLRLDHAADRVSAELTGIGPEELHGHVVERVVSAARAFDDGGSDVDADNAAHLVVAMAVSARIRDDIITLPDVPLAGLSGYLCAVARLTPDPHAAGICSMVAAIALRCGNGALANVAIDRALTNDSAYTLALVLDDMARALLPPSVVQEWVEAARSALTREREEPSRRYGEGRGVLE